MNILDLSPEEFEFALEEMGLEPEREKFLRDEFAKKNTVSGQMLSAFQEATAVPEGKERTNIAPMIKPEGMSGLEAIRSGEAELAVPGFLTGAVEEPLQALTTGEKVAQGLKVTEDELQQAAGVGAGLGLSGAVTRIGKPLDRTVLSSGGAAGSGKPFKPTMFSTGDVPLKPSGYSVAEFYSPVVETIRNAEFPSKGYKGSELLKLLQDKTPGIRKAELDAMNLGIDPQKRYTQEELLDLAQRRSYRVSAEVVDNDIFGKDQRQDIRDPEVDYATLKVNATPNSEEVAAFLPMRGYTHYDPETVAHTRMSIREGQGGEYALIEEIQSDLLQHGVTKPRGAITVDQAYDEVLELVSGDIAKDPKLKPVYDSNKEYFDNLFKIGAENSRQFTLREKGLEVPAEDVQRLENLIERTRNLADEIDATGKPDERSFQRLATMFENSGYDEGYRIDRRTAPTGKSPLTEDSDAVRLTLQAAMAKAADSDVKSLVIPNVERIVAADRARPGSKDYLSYVDPKSGFTRTYVKGVEKFIKQLQDQYGDAVKVEVVELPYTKQTHYYEGQEYTLPTTAVKIDFSGIEGVDFRVSRFAEGGMVEDSQMRKLFREGGMTDDGMDVEPVTGNEIPPGSMALEVRDDIPAQLSEGEYVVPADVVRFFGVKFFEDLRARAKQGLSEMDADGRIGGTAVDSNGIPVEGADDELTPEEEAMLMEALGATGMANGGMATQTPANPYHSAGMLTQQPLMMAEGGMVRGLSTFDRTQFTIPEAMGAFESRKYINPTTGEERTVQFLNGMPMGSIPEGFVPWTAEIANQVDQAKNTVAVEAPSVTPVQVTSGGGSDRDSGTPTSGQTGGGSGGSGIGNYDKWAKENYEAISKDPYKFGTEALSDKSGNVTSTALMGAGLLTGFAPAALAGLGTKAVNKIQNIAEAQAALKVMESQGLQNSEKYNLLDKQIDAAIADLPGAQRLAVKSGITASGTGYFEALNKVGSTPAAPAAQPASAKPTASTTTTPVPQTTLSFGAAVTPPATSSRDSSDRTSSLAFSPSTTGGKSATSTVTSTGAGSSKVSFSPSTTGGKTTPTASTKASDYSLGSTTAKDTGKTVSTSAGNLSMGTPAPAKTGTATSQKSKDIASGKTAAAGKSYTSVGGYRSGRATGGLVSKTSTPKPKKGLAGKP